MTKTSAAFDPAWLVAGIIALVVYCAFPTWMMGFADPSVVWFHALWLVPAGVITAGFILRSRRGGRIAILVGSLLLSPVTLLFVGMLLAVLLAGCQLTLVAIGALGLTAARRSRWGFARWVLLLTAPILASAVLQAGVALWVWPADQAEPGAEKAFEFPVPFADGIHLDGPMVTQGVPSEVYGSFEMPLAEAMQAERSLLESEGWSVSAAPPGETSGTMTVRRSGREATLTFERSGPLASDSGGTVVVRLTEM